jgi:hypothetical protein
LYNSFRRLSVSFALGTCLLGAHTNDLDKPVVPPAAQELSWWSDLWKLPFLQLFAPPPPAVEVEMSALTELEPPPPPAVPPCMVQPLPMITDAEALTFEDSSHGVDFAGLTDGTEKALSVFQRIVGRAGGTMTITSAFRPASYQEHLRNVWQKWMLELRYNNDEACSELKQQAREEFVRHGLLERQQPVVSSDHTRGIGFDASILLPFRGKAKRSRGLSIDLLARKAGFRRPDIFRDPVHFRFIGG